MKKLFFLGLGFCCFLNASGMGHTPLKSDVQSAEKSSPQGQSSLDVFKAQDEKRQEAFFRSGPVAQGLYIRVMEEVYNKANGRAGGYYGQVFSQFNALVKTMGKEASRLAGDQYCADATELIHRCMYLHGMGTELILKRADLKQLALLIADGIHRDELSSRISGLLAVNGDGPEWRLCEVRKRCYELFGIVDGEISKIEAEIKKIRDRTWLKVRKYYSRGFLEEIHTVVGLLAGCKCADWSDSSGVVAKWNNMLRQREVALEAIRQYEETKAAADKESRRLEEAQAALQESNARFENLMSVYQQLQEQLKRLEANKEVSDSLRSEQENALFGSISELRKQLEVAESVRKEKEGHVSALEEEVAVLNREMEEAKEKVVAAEKRTALFHDVIVNSVVDTAEAVRKMSLEDSDFASVLALTHDKGTSLVRFGEAAGLRRLFVGDLGCLRTQLNSCSDDALLAVFGFSQRLAALKGMPLVSNRRFVENEKLVEWTGGSLSYTGGVDKRSGVDCPYGKGMYEFSIGNRVYVFKGEFTDAAGTICLKDGRFYSKNLPDGAFVMNGGFVLGNLFCLQQGTQKFVNVYLDCSNVAIVLGYTAEGDQNGIILSKKGMYIGGLRCHGSVFSWVNQLRRSSFADASNPLASFAPSGVGDFYMPTAHEIGDFDGTKTVAQLFDEFGARRATVQLGTPVRTPRERKRLSLPSPSAGKVFNSGSDEDPAPPAAE